MNVITIDDYRDHDDRYRYDDYDHDSYSYDDRHYYRDNDYDHEDFELAVRSICDEDRHMPDFTVRAGGETQYIDIEEFEDDGNAKVKFYLTDVDDKRESMHY